MNMKIQRLILILTMTHEGPKSNRFLEGTLEGSADNARNSQNLSNLDVTILKFVLFILKRRAESVSAESVQTKVM